MNYWEITILFTLAILLLVGVQVAAQTVPELLTMPAPNGYPTYPGNGINITANELVKAGFTGVEAITPTVTKFYSPENNFPNFYFRVKETVAGEQGKAWGDAANIVEVLIRQMPADWVFNNDQVQLVDLAGRTQARASKTGYYFVVTGQDQEKASKLIDVLKSIY